MKFLCAEDNEIDAKILKMLPEIKGASCKNYRNGQELVDAFALVRPGDYDLILMDMQMPVMGEHLFKPVDIAALEQVARRYRVPLKINGGGPKFTRQTP